MVPLPSAPLGRAAEASQPPALRLLAFARELQRARDFGELIEAVATEVRAAIGFRHAWMFVAEDEDAKEFRLLDASSGMHDRIWDKAPILQVEGDLMIQEILRGDHPVVVEDARTDPRTDKQMVMAIGNRTIINVPLRLLDRPFGALGVGTFEDEGVRPPTPEQLDYLVAMASQVVVAAGRIRFLAERAREARERAEHERRLARAQRLESLGLLAGGVAHDFNNLLTVVLASAAMLRDVVKDPDAAGDVEAIAGAARRGRDLATQLLAMGRAQALDVRAIDVNAQVEELARLLRRVLPAGITLEVKPAAGLPPVSGDPSRIDQLLMNLCLNARDAMPDGGRLSLETGVEDLGPSFVEAHPWARPGHYVLVTVTDTGVGMAPEVRERIFEPFFTTKAPSERSGSGLGLAVAYGIVRQHDGLLHCYSEPGVGTCFKIYLPQGSPVHAAPAVRRREPVRGRAERVLLAEDDAAVRTAVGRLLAGAGYHVELAADGAAAVELARARAFDVVILDVAMPHVSGPAALRLIRELWPHARYVLTSGYLGEAAAVAARDARPDALLQKPYDPDALIDRIRELLDDTRGGA
jgi:signal transduction histidine kinase/ActR/RegA family two-component response regulator